MTRAPIANLKSKRAQKASTSLQERLAKPLRDFVSDFEKHGADALKTVREQNPEKYLELATKLAQLVAAIKPDTVPRGEDTHEALGRDILKSIGFDDPDPASIQCALEAQAIFLAALQNIKNNAEGGLKQ